MGRPATGRKGDRTSIYLSKQAKEIVVKAGFQSNLSEFINQLITSTSEDSPEYVKIKILDLSKQIAKEEELLNTLRTERDILQGKINLYKRKDDIIGSTRTRALEQFYQLRKNRTTTETHIRNWFENRDIDLHFVRDGGFSDVAELIAWCKSQEGRVP
jgi:cell division protein FtsB